MPRNLAVEWRLEPPTARRFDVAAASPTRVFGRWPLRGLAVAAVVEAAIVLGAAYGFLEHAGHHDRHGTHVDLVKPGGRVAIHDVEPARAVVLRETAPHRTIETRGTPIGGPR